ncbi:hypothetical protein JCM6882_000390 [Rhodosporidiobolus microsporus]
MQMLRTAFRRPLRRVAAPSSSSPRAASLPFRGFRTAATTSLQALSASTPSSKPAEVILHEAFDSPTSSYISSPSSTSPSGLFGQPSLTHPAALCALASRTTLRAKLIVKRLCRLVALCFFLLRASLFRCCPLLLPSEVATIVPPVCGPTGAVSKVYKV